MGVEYVTADMYNAVFSLFITGMIIIIAVLAFFYDRTKKTQEGQLTQDDLGILESLSKYMIIFFALITAIGFGVYFMMTKRYSLKNG